MTLPPFDSTMSVIRLIIRPRTHRPCFIVFVTKERSSTATSELLYLYERSATSWPIRIASSLRLFERALRCGSTSLARPLRCSAAIWLRMRCILFSNDRTRRFIKEASMTWPVVMSRTTAVVWFVTPTSTPITYLSLKRGTLDWYFNRPVEYDPVSIVNTDGGRNNFDSGF